MPRGGHNRLPDHLKVIKGTFENSRATPNVPQPEPGVPDYPKGLRAIEKREYDRLIEDTTTLGVLSKTDGKELEHLARIRAAIVYLGGMLWKEKDFNKWRRIQLALNEAIKISSAMSMRFGLTPADRGRVSAFPKKPEDKWQK